MRPNKNRTATLFILCVLLPGCAITFGCYPYPKVWEEIRESLKADCLEISKLDVQTHNGNLNILGDDSVNEIQVEAFIKAGGRDVMDAKRCLESIMIVFERQGDTQVLKWKWDGAKDSGWGANVGFNVVLPPSIEIKAETHNGEVVTRDTIAPLALNTHNGNVTIKNQKNMVDASTHNGRIKIDAITSSLDLVSHNGSITGRLGAVPVLDGSVVTHNGHVSFDILGRPSTTLSCDTSHGSITCNKDVRAKIVKRSYFKGVIGDGEKGRFSITTHNGSIRIDGE